MVCRDYSGRNRRKCLFVIFGGRRYLIQIPQAKKWLFGDGKILFIEYIIPCNSITTAKNVIPGTVKMESTDITYSSTVI